MKIWLKRKWIIIQFNYYNILYVDNIKKFFPEEQDRLRTIKDSFVFHKFVTKNNIKIEKELFMFRELVRYRLNQKKYKFA